MGYFLPKLWADIRNRALDDDGTGGLFNLVTPGEALVLGGITNHWGEPEGDYPALVYTLVSATPADGFRTRTREVLWDMHVLVEEQPAAGGDPLNTGALILDRIAGDWDEQPPGTAPTYGFDRWTPPLADTGWSASICEAVDSREEHTEGMYHWVESFRVFVSKVGASA